MVTRPLLGRRFPFRTFSSVLFPDPLPPMMPMSFPEVSRSLSSCSPFVPLGKAYSIPSAWNVIELRPLRFRKLPSMSL